MKSIKEYNFFGNFRNRLFLTLSLNVIAFTIFAIIFDFKYETNDDLTLSVFVETGYYCANFVNYILLMFLSWLQNIFTDINMFIVFQLISTFCAFSVIIYVILDKFKNYYGILFSVLLAFTLGSQGYVMLQFTKTSAYLLCAGSLLIIHALSDKKLKSQYILGTVLILFGSALRFTNLFAAMAIVFIYFIADCLHKGKFKGIKKQGFKSIKTFVKENSHLFVVVSIVLILSFGADFASSMLNQSTEELDFYNEYTQLRGQIFDYNVPSYENFKEEYTQIGLTENDVKFLGGYELDRFGPFDAQTLKGVVQIQQSNKQSLISSIANMFADVRQSLLSFGIESYFIIFTAILSLMLIIFSRKRYYIVALDFIGIVLYIYLYSTGRAPVPFRSMMIIFVFVLTLLLYSIDINNFHNLVYKIKQKTFLKTIFTVLVVGFVALNVHYVNLQYNKYELNQRVQSELLWSEITENPNNLYISTVSTYETIPVFDNPLEGNVYENYLENYYLIRGWTYASPFNIDILAKFDVVSPYQDTIDNENVYFIYTKIEERENYINDYYSQINEEIYFEKVDEIDGFSIYQIKSKILS